MKKKFFFTTVLLIAVLLVCGAFMPACSGGGDGKITVSLRLNYKGATGHPPDIRVTEGKPYGALPSPTRANYAFAGWFDVSSPTGGGRVTAETVVTEKYEHVLYARWRGNEVTVSIDLMGGTTFNGLLSVPDCKVRVGAFYGVAVPVDKPVKDGADFRYWYIETEDGELRVDETSVVSVASDHTICAKWREYVSFIDFSAPSDAEFFTGLGTFKTVTREGGKTWLEANGNGSAKIIMNFTQKVKAGTVVRFTADFNNKPILNGLGIWVFHYDNSWQADDLTVTNQSTDAKPWDAARRVSYRVPKDTDNLQIQVLYDQYKEGGPDYKINLDTVRFYLTDIAILTPADLAVQTSFTFDDEEDAAYFTNAGADIKAYDVVERGDGKNWLRLTPQWQNIHWRFNRPMRADTTISFWVDFGTIAEKSGFSFAVTRNSASLANQYFLRSDGAWNGPEKITFTTNAKTDFLHFYIAFGPDGKTVAPWQVYMTGFEIKDPPPPKDNIAFDDAVDLKYFILTDTVSALEERAGQNWMRLSGAAELQYALLNMPVAAGSVVSFYVDFGGTALPITSGLGFSVQNSAAGAHTYYCDQMYGGDDWTGQRLIEYTVAEDTETLTFIISYRRPLGKLIPANMLCFITDIQITRS